MPAISPLSVVDPKADLAPDVQVGPFCMIGPEVRIGAGCKLIAHVTMLNHTTVGRNNTFFPNCVIGAAPQDKKYRGSPTRLEIGDDNAFREAVTIHIGTEPPSGHGVTRLGSGNLLMVNCHVGHDAQIGNNCVLSNNVMLAGHVHIGNNVAMMGLVGLHHYVTVGDYAYLGGAARIHHDVPPFVKVDGDDRVRGLNVVGLRRAGFSEPDIEALDEACRKLFLRKKPMALALEEYDTLNGLTPNVRAMIEFLRRRNLGHNGRYLESLRTR
jgi:UDP-N-acetylglucosamine acyltransferase